MNTYRIIETKKEGYYKYYRVQVRCLLFFWMDDSRAFDKLSEAQAWIKDQNVRQVTTVVHTE